MKRFSVKVNGQVYEVDVTELQYGESTPASAYTAPAYSHAAPAVAAPLSTGIVHPQPTTYTVSYTHLDVYKRQDACR